MPYRIPAELPGDPEDAEVPAPATWRRQSSRVLGALARLTEARGSTDTAGDLEDRARRAKQEESDVRTLPRCIAGLDALEKSRLDLARRALTTWLEDATVLAASPRDRVEAHLALAAVAGLQEHAAEADVHLRNAFACGPVRVGRSAPLALSLVTARALLAVERPDLAVELLEPRRERDATLQYLRAAVAFANDELARAQIHAGEALDLAGPDLASAGETRVLIARIQVRCGRREQAEHTLALAIDNLETAERKARFAEAEAFGWAATFLAARPDAARATRALEIGAALVRDHWKTPSTAMLPFLIPAARVAHAMGRSAQASSWDAAVAEARAGFPTSR